MATIPSPKLIFSLVAFSIPALADPLVYLASADPVTGIGLFGTLDLTTGAYQQIGPTEPDGYFGLAAGPNGSLVSLTYTGGLDSINPATGVFTRIGPTGLGNCLIPDPSCPPTSAFTLGSFAGTIYATDFKNSIYVINTSTAAATLLALHSGIPPSPFVLGTQNPDGTLNFADEAIWSATGKLYATYDAFTFNPITNSVASVVITPELYQLDPSTGIATLIGGTDLGIGAVVDVNGTSYAFNDLTNQIESIDLSTGNTNVIGQFDSAAGVIQGASAAPSVPEPSSLALAVIGICITVFGIRRKRTGQLTKMQDHG